MQTKEEHEQYVINMYGGIPKEILLEWYADSLYSNMLLKEQNLYLQDILQYTMR